MDNTPDNTGKLCKPKLPPKPLLDGEVSRPHSRRLKSLPTPGRMHIHPGGKPPLLPKPQLLKKPSPSHSSLRSSFSSTSSTTQITVVDNLNSSNDSYASVFESISISSSADEMVVGSKTNPSISPDNSVEHLSVNCERIGEVLNPDNNCGETVPCENFKFSTSSHSFVNENEVDGSNSFNFVCEDSINNLDIVVDLNVNLVETKSDENSIVERSATDAEGDSQSSGSSFGSFTVIPSPSEKSAADSQLPNEAPIQSFLHSLSCIKKTTKQKCDKDNIESPNDSNLENSIAIDEPSSSKIVHSSSLSRLDTSKKRNSLDFNPSTGSWCENDNDIESNDGLRRKFTSWFGSFGKGNKHKDKRESCLFYCDNENDVTMNNDVNKDESDCPVIEISVKNSDDEKDPSEKLVPEDLDEVDVTVDSNSVTADSSSLLTGEVFDVENNRSSMSEESFEIGHNQLNSEQNESVETALERKRRKAFFVARELMTSEKVFIDVLKLLCFDFKEFIKQTNKDLKCCVIPEEEFNKIFHSLPQLLGLSEDLFQDLESRMSNWDNLPKISDILVKKGPFLKLCSVYIQNFEAQCNCLDECCQKYPRFAKAVECFEQSDRCKKLTLKHYMLKPVQRIPQYRMLLDDYLSHLDESSPDYLDTQRALQIVSDVANHANKSIKNMEHLGKLLQIQEQLGNYELIKPSRRFIKEGELCKLSRKESQLRYFILLNDCLLYTTFYGSMTGFRVKYELPLSGMKVTVPQSDDCRTEFSIISSTRSFTLRAKTAEECNDWVVTLQNAIKENISRQSTFINLDFAPKNMNAESIKLGKEAPIWIQDKKVTMCQSCTAEFTVTFRRHHCRACGKVVCSNCSENKAPLQYLKFQSARVCDDCHSYLIKEFNDPSSNMFDTIKTVFKLEDDEAVSNKTEYIHSLFKKQPSTMKKTKKYVPQRLKEVTANDSGSQMSGSMYMQGLDRGRSWKRRWFVLKQQVLYIYKAQEDVAALKSVPVLGYKVETVKEGLYDDSEMKFMFQLTHVNQHPLVFAVDSQHTASRWITAFEEATILK
ncbi:hypothetical protein LSTR_LSTR004162 [Laodelphax striatellus]|uniref:FYVE, RhoGEF and PH domain-containing protein 6 n=1 Tax=Laodelphax striatellus TaxID=195883 RepID=A0A482X970_LAOST|nr:hypothetical protein LSTR_LSTR004162 [Laodelphax striatellus]